MGNLNKNTVRFRMENKAGLNVNESKSKCVLGCMKWVCGDQHYGRVHLTYWRHLLVQNASKWRGKLFCWVFFSSECWCEFLRRVVLLVCHHARSQWGDEDMGIGPGKHQAHGPWFWWCTSSGAGLWQRCYLPKSGHAEVLPPEELGLLSQQKWGCLG